VTESSIGYLDPTKNKFSSDQIKAGTAANIDLTKKEAYLSDDEFLKLFKCSRDEFDKQPKWKKDQKKKELKLF